MSAFQFAIASSSNQTVKSPRRRSPSLYSAQLRTWYFFCFAWLVLAALGILHARTYLGHHHRRISLSARAVQQRPINVQFGAILGLIGTFLRLIVQTMRRRLTPRSRLRRRRIAEFELAKPRIHPAEFYGGNEDDSADGPVQGAIQVWKPWTGNLGQFESDWWRPVSESSLLLTEPIHEVGAGRLTAF